MMAFENFVGPLIEAPGGRRWEPQEVRRQVAARTAAYSEAGLDPGDRVLIHFGNRLEFFAELLAIWKLGGCAIPVDARLTSFEVRKLATTARASFSVFAGEADADQLASVRGSSVLFTEESGDRDGAGSDAGLDGGFPWLDDDALILFTSGSTGQPKGVVHTHRSLLARWISLRQAIGLERYRRTLCLLPTHFGHGLICNCLFPWLAGCTLVIAPPFRTDLVMNLGRIIDEHDISFMSSVPSMWNLALRTSPRPEGKTLQRVHIGSAPLSAATWTSVQEWSGTREVFNTYGITETASWVAGTTGGEVVPESGLIGEAWGAAIAVRSDSGEPRPEGETGMVWLQTPALMRGYFERPDLTEAAVQQGWFQTGDIGLIDERGRLHLKGRERDEINKGGMKVFPADIDEVVEQFSGTHDACSFGFEDSFYGENVGLAVVLDEPGEGRLLELHDWIGAHLAEHKQPARWYLLDEIPRTSRGKINRESVRDACLDQPEVDLRSLLNKRKNEA